MTILRVLMASLWPFHVGQIGSVPCARVQVSALHGGMAALQAVRAALRKGLRAAYVEPLLLRVLRQIVHAALQRRGRGRDVEPDAGRARSRVGPRRQDLWDDAVIQQQMHPALGPVRRKLLVPVSDPRAGEGTSVVRGTAQRQRARQNERTRRAARAHTSRRHRKPAWERRAGPRRSRPADERHRPLVAALSHARTRARKMCSTPSGQPRPPRMKAQPLQRATRSSARWALQHGGPPSRVHDAGPATIAAHYRSGGELRSIGGAAPALPGGGGRCLDDAARWDSVLATTTEPADGTEDGGRRCAGWITKPTPIRAGG